jgi:hypothetical protein
MSVGGGGSIRTLNLGYVAYSPQDKKRVGDIGRGTSIAIMFHMHPSHTTNTNMDNTFNLCLNTPNIGKVA